MSVTPLVGELAVEYVTHGLALVPIQRGQKGPTTPGWNRHETCVTDRDAAEKLRGNIGLAHAWSTPPTCALDIDDFNVAVEWLAVRGIDLSRLLMADNAVQISSGRDNRAKLLYRLPEGTGPLPTLKPEGSGIELRCADRGGAVTVQDVLPPSIHPDTRRPYKWGGAGDWRRIPTLPEALLKLWRDCSTVGSQQGPRLGIEHDPVLIALDERNMVLGPLRGKSGGWSIRCPWEAAHTQKGGKADTAYFEPHTNGYAGGAFNCLHSHCENRGIWNLRAWLGTSNEASCLYAVATFIQSDDPTKQPSPRPQTDILIDIGLKASKVLFCGDDDRPYAVIGDNHGVWPIGSKRFREWLRGLYFKLTGKGANANSVRDAVETICSKAQFSGEKRKVFLRSAEAGGKFYIDLTDDAWRVVEIDRDGWRILNDSPVMFIRRGAPAPLPIPETGGTVHELWGFLNLKELNWPLVAGWLLMALSPRGPYPVLVLHGEEGSAKSSMARMLRSLCDPSLVPLRAPTRDERDFLVGAVGNWCVVIDNLSDLQPALSDSVCRLSTGGGFSARTLYTDCDETAISIKRPVILNGIDAFVVRGDLVSRSIVLQLGTIEEGDLRDEAELWAKFEAARPRIFGALLTGFSAAIGTVDSVKLTRRPRMVDFAKWATAAEVELGFKPGEFLDAYMGNLHDNALATLESPVAQALIVFMAERREWTGTATELLNSIAPPLDGRSNVEAWPKTGRGLVSALNRLAPALRRIGFSVEHLMREPGKGTRRLRLVYKPPAQPSQPSHSSQASPGAGSERDGSTSRDGSTVTESRQPSQTVIKNPNEFNASDGCDDCDGLAGTLHGRKRTVVL